MRLFTLLLAIMYATLAISQQKSEYHLVKWTGNVMVNDKKLSVNNTTNIDGSTKIKIPKGASIRMKHRDRIYNIPGLQEGQIAAILQQVKEKETTTILSAIQFLWDKIKGQLSKKEATNFVASTGAGERGEDELNFTDSIYIALCPYLMSDDNDFSPKLKYEWMKDSDGKTMYLKIKNLSDDVLAVNVICQYSGCNPILWFCSKTKRNGMPPTIILEPNDSFEIKDLTRDRDESCKITLFGTKRFYDSNRLQKLLVSGWQHTPCEADIIF